MRIDSLKTTPDRAGRYWISFEDGSKMALYRQTVEDFGLYTGLDLDENQLEKLRDAAGQMSAKMRAVRIVSASSVSRRELEHRLIQKGEDPEQARQAVDWMEDLQLVDDQKTAEQIVDRCIQKGYGLMKAKQVLYEKRIPKSLWDDDLADYPDQCDKIVDFLRNKLSEDSGEKEIKRAVDALIRRGHGYGEIKRGLHQLSLEWEDFREDDYG